MSRTFHPIKSIVIPASTPHKEGTEYVISQGFDDHIEGSPIVKKVQVAHNGVVMDNVVPSFPIGTDDMQRVNKALSDLDTMNTIGGKAFRAEVITMCRNLGYHVDIKVTNEICDNIANDSRIFETIEDCINEYFGRKER